jgi:CRISPR/Cas system CSM-associated protein Csm2 small subunit
LLPPFLQENVPVAEETENHTAASPELTAATLQEALEATDRQLRRLLRLITDRQDLESDRAQKDVKRTRRRLRENRELLARQEP